MTGEVRFSGTSQAPIPCLVDEAVSMNLLPRGKSRGQSARENTEPRVQNISRLNVCLATVLGTSE
jgi:hypothetical protein